MRRGDGDAAHLCRTDRGRGDRGAAVSGHRGAPALLRPVRRGLRRATGRPEQPGDLTGTRCSPPAWPGGGHVFPGTVAAVTYCRGSIPQILDRFAPVPPPTHALPRCRSRWAFARPWTRLVPIGAPQGKTPAAADANHR